MQVLQADDDAICLQLRFAAEMPELTAYTGEVDKQERPSLPSIYPWLSGPPGAQKGERFSWRYRLDDDVQPLITGLELQFLRGPNLAS